MLKGIEVEHAIDIMLSQKVDLKTEYVDTADLAGRVIVNDFIADHSVPSFPKSPFDGYALIAEDTYGVSEEKPVGLKILREIPAGKSAGPEPLVRGCAVKILTGAPIPVGANTTIKYEFCRVEGDTVYISTPLEANKNIVPVGEHYKKGDILAAAGTRITPPLASIIASQGTTEVEVYCRPKAALIATGSELVELGQECKDAEIYSSNCYAITAYLEDMGFEVNNMGIVEDELEPIKNALNEGLENNDVVITTGGASVGDYDFGVRGAEACGAEVLFWKVRSKPGGAIVFSARDNKYIISLSGNPGAAAMGLVNVSSAFLRKLCGRSDVKNKTVMVKVREDVKKKSPIPVYLRGHLEIEDGEVYFEENRSSGNGDIMVFHNCTVIATIPADETPKAGDLIKAYCVNKSVTL